MTSVIALVPFQAALLCLFRKGELPQEVYMVYLGKLQMEASSPAHSKTDKPPPSALACAEMPRRFPSQPSPALLPGFLLGFGWVCREAPGIGHHHWHE